MGDDSTLADQWINQKLRVILSYTCSPASKATAMRIETTRFGKLDINERELFFFPQGLIGLETLRQWALIPDPQSPAVAWLQSASRGDRALPLISPRAFVEGYRVRVNRRALSSLHLRTGDETYVLTTLAGMRERLTTNLRAPLVLNLTRKLGVQVVTEDDHSMQHQISTAVMLRRAA